MFVDIFLNHLFGLYQDLYFADKSNFLLLENGCNLLLEDGDSILLEGN